MKRYSIYTGCECGRVGDDIVAEENENGDWIKYSDYEKENANLGEARNAVLADVCELIDKIDELKKDFNPYNFCDYEKLLWDQILRITEKLRANEQKGGINKG